MWGYVVCWEIRLITFPIIAQFADQIFFLNAVKKNRSNICLIRLQIWSLPTSQRKLITCKIKRLLGLSEEEMWIGNSRHIGRASCNKRQQIKCFGYLTTNKSIQHRSGYIDWGRSRGWCKDKPKNILKAHTKQLKQHVLLWRGQILQMWRGEIVAAAAYGNITHNK